MSPSPVASRPSLRLTSLLVAVLSVQLSGCALNPYVANQRPPRQEPASSNAYGMQNALLYADGLYDAYSAKFSEEFKRQQILSSGLLTLGAVVLGLGAAKAHRDAFVGAGLVGGLSYELGTWNTSDGRAGIYLEGMKTVSCAKLAIAPLNVGSDQVEQLGKHVARARDALGRAARAAGATTRWLSLMGPTSTPLQTAAASELAELDGVASAASTALTRAASFETRVRQAGPMLEGQLEEISRLVTKALNGTQASLAELPKAIAALNGYAQVVVPGLDLGPALKNSVAAANKSLGASSAEAADGEPGGAPDDKGARSPAPTMLTPEQGLARALGSLRAARLLLATAVAEVIGAMDVGTVEDAKTRLAGCGRDFAAAAPPLSLKRSSVNFIAGTAGTSVVEVSGGTRPFSAALLDLPAPGVNVSAVPGGGAVLVSATAEAPAGRTFAAVVSDASGATASLSIRIDAKPGTSAEAANGDPSPAPGPARAACIAPHDAPSVCLIQHVLRVRMDGQWGPQSCSALRSRGGAYAPDGVVGARAMGLFKTEIGLAADADGAAILKSLRDRGQPCEAAGPGDAVAAAPRLLDAPVAPLNGVPAPADAAAASCRPIANPAACRIKGAVCQSECLLAEGELAALRGRMGLPGQPAEFDAALRGKLARFQADRQLKNTRGEYTPETAEALRAR